MYDFPSDEDNCGYDEVVPLIVRYVDEIGFMSSKNLLVDREDTHVQIVERNGTTVANDGTSH